MKVSLLVSVCFFASLVTINAFSFTPSCRKGFVLTSESKISESLQEELNETLGVGRWFSCEQNQKFLKRASCPQGWSETDGGPLFFECEKKEWLNPAPDICQFPFRKERSSVSLNKETGEYSTFIQCQYSDVTQHVEICGDGLPALILGKTTSARIICATTFRK